MENRNIFRLKRGDALIVIDVQNDFLPGGTLALADGAAIIPALNQYLQLFHQFRLPIFATRDWHPWDHCSFQAFGGIWPVHCVQNTSGARLSDDLRFPGKFTVIDKATTKDKDAYSGFSGTHLHAQLSSLGISRLYVGGLATDYCVLQTVLDASRLGYHVIVLDDAIRAVNIKPDDEIRAKHEMKKVGAAFITVDELVAVATHE